MSDEEMRTMREELQAEREANADHAKDVIQLHKRAIKAETERDDAQWAAVWYEAHIEDCRRSVDYWKSHYEKQRQRAEKAEKERDAWKESARSTFGEEFSRNTALIESLRKVLSSDDAWYVGRKTYKEYIRDLLDIPEEEDE